MEFALQLAVVLVCLFYAARKGGVALGLIGGVGLMVLVFGFGLAPGKPPTAVILTILAVVAASATLQASGGLECMLQVAERILRRNPKYVSVLAPFLTCFLTMLCGTGHVVYTMLPIIYDVAIKNGIRPERPLAASTISSQMGICASPVSVAMVSFVAIFATAGATINGAPVTLIDVMKLTIPSTFLGILVVAAFSWFRGKDLDKDADFQARIADPATREYVYGDTTTLLGRKLPGHQWLAMWIFIGAVAFIGALGAFAELRPVFKGKAMSMVLCIQMVMLCAGALMVMFAKTDPVKIGKNEVFRSGMIAIVAVFGIAWMADTVFEANMPMLKAGLVDVVKEYPWMYAIVLVLVSKFVNSQAASVAAIVPVALAIGLDPGYVLAFAAACYGYYILPTYPSDLAAIQFDRSGTTRIGKYVINHSFIVPGLLGVGSSCVFGYILATIYGYI